MIVADVGNRHIHIYEDGRVIHLEFDEAIEYFGSQRLFYICVNDEINQKIKQKTFWRDISNLIHLPGEYEGMGVDRKALCLSRGDGIYLDAGSAITVDKVHRGRYIGGALFPGLYAYKKAYSFVSKRLDFDIDELEDVHINRLPKGTKNQIGYSILKPIVDMVDSLRDGLPLYITGGDGIVFTHFFPDANFSDKLIFEGIMKVFDKR